MQNRFFPQLTPVTRRVLVLFVALDYLLTTLVILLFATDLFEPIAAATGGLINRTLLGNLPLILILVGGVLFGLGRLRARDLGLVGSRLGTALAYTAGLWLLIQLIELALGFALNGTITPAPEWSQLGVLAVLGGLIGQLGGNALYEDIAYRGFLFPQIWARLAARWPVHPGRALVAALLGSQALFALRHVPIRILQGFDPVDLAISLAMVLAIGVIYALLYLRTQNLFLVIGAHALYDAPTALFAPTLVDPSLLLLAAALVTVLVWPRVVHRAHATGPLEAARPS